jgi:hypothetical protein
MGDVGDVGDVHVPVTAVVVALVASHTWQERHSVSLGMVCYRAFAVAAFAATALRAYLPFAQMVSAAVDCLRGDLSPDAFFVLSRLSFVLAVLSRVLPAWVVTAGAFGLSVCVF